MSAILYLLRHGVAADATAEVSDADRALTADGARKMQHIARGLKRVGFRPDVILTSPLRRTQETAALLAAVDPAVTVEIYPPLAPGHGAVDIIVGLRAFRGKRRIVLVGHQPDLGELASHLLTGSASRAPLPFKKGAMAAIAVATVPPRTPGLLQWFATPKMLRSMGGKTR
jgi:phosphohistidine phosphatase